MPEVNFICHFDSDDWSAPERVTDQVTRLGTFGVVTGYHSMLFYDERDGRCYHWHMSVFARAVCAGHVVVLSLGMVADTIRFSRCGSEKMCDFFSKPLREAHRLVPTVPADKLMVARVHDHQTSRKSLEPKLVMRRCP